MRITTNWRFVILISIFWINQLPASATSTGNFILLPHIPGAASVVTVPFVFEKQHCANKCLLDGSCQGFLMVVTEVHPCQLLIGLDGSKAPSDPNIEAFISLNYDGVPHNVMRLKISWDDGLAICQSMGKTMISYPVSMDKRNWLKALNTFKMLIGAKKDLIDNTLIYDINTGSLLTVDWLVDERLITNTVLFLIPEGKFEPINSWYKWPNPIVLVCAPVA